MTMEISISKTQDLTASLKLLVTGTLRVFGEVVGSVTGLKDLS